MIIQKIPSPFLTIIDDFESRFFFSDDSRFIYVSRPKQVILVYDNKYNKYVTLNGDDSAQNLRTIKNFKFDSCTPFIHVVNRNTLLLSFDDECFDISENGNSALLILIRLNFFTKTFSIIDKKVYQHCFYSYLLQDSFQYVLLHISEVEIPMDEGNECKSFLLEINENQISQKQIDPIIFDYDYLSLFYRPINLHFHDNKIWFFRDAEPIQRVSLADPTTSEIQLVNQLSYFDLNASTPIKETTVELLNENGDSYYIGGFLFYFPNQFEYQMLNLHTKTWTTGKNNSELQKFDFQHSGLVSSNKLRTRHGPYNIDKEFNITVIDKTTKRLLLVPLKIPQKLYDIAWTTALNAGLLSQKESKLSNILKYEKLF